MYAVPLTCKFLQFLLEEPKSNALCIIGKIEELTSPPNWIISVVWLPIVMLPPNTISPVKSIDPVCEVFPVM